MADRILKTVAGGFNFTEGPRWHEDRLWFSDLYGHRVYVITPGGAVEAVVEVEQQPSGIGWLPDGRMLIVSQLDKRILRLEPDGSLSVHADLSDLAPSTLNDMIVSESGYAYVANLGFDFIAGQPVTPTRLIKVDPDGKAELAGDPLLFPNGMGITPDGRSLIVDESFGHRVSVLSIASDGTLSDSQPWATFGDLPGDLPTAEYMGALSIMPDGMCLDAEGCAWVADAIGCRVVRVRQGGEILEEIHTGDRGAFACVLGGSDRRTLFICTALPLSEHERTYTEQTATIEACDVDVPGAGLP